MRVKTVIMRVFQNNNSTYTWSQSMMERKSPVRDVITGALQNNILDYTWDSSIGKTIHVYIWEKTLVGKIHFRKIHFNNIGWA